ncbi:hypothetical protein BDK51DRAFT_47013 [Blyttiomyces helicus]|uniref:Uncharacterized protein n=1 Tax=Blyttiomyces helicus TaxID=388810 RepID=A0A4V1IQF7_9FUNG|nr:hypothetical protein BDK51DRAFT_47013 [Blyttiomyces helicus]|eukprot:RKO86397.1 hypothetical protein BDK51DRAFT_47013 [Blyttiomyces helicus]
MESSSGRHGGGTGRFHGGPQRDEGTDRIKAEILRVDGEFKAHGPPAPGYALAGVLYAIWPMLAEKLHAPSGHPGLITIMGAYPTYHGPREHAPMMMGAGGVAPVDGASLPRPTIQYPPPNALNRRNDIERARARREFAHSCSAVHAEETESKTKDVLAVPAKETESKTRDAPAASPKIILRFRIGGSTLPKPDAVHSSAPISHPAPDPVAPPTSTKGTVSRQRSGTNQHELEKERRDDAREGDEDYADRANKTKRVSIASVDGENKVRKGEEAKATTASGPSSNNDGFSLGLSEREGGFAEVLFTGGIPSPSLSVTRRGNLRPPAHQTTELATFARPRAEKTFVKTCRKKAENYGYGAFGGRAPRINDDDSSEDGEKKGRERNEAEGKTASGPSSNKTMNIPPQLQPSLLRKTEIYG